MQSVPHLFSGPDTRLETATVNFAEHDVYMVAGPSGAFRALRAEGCLLVPVRGDKVLLVLCPTEAYILSVLVRACVVAQPFASAPENPRLALPANTTLDAPGRLHLQADELELTGRERLSLHGRAIHCAGELLTQSFTQLESVATHVHQTIGRCIAVFGKRRVEVEDVDELKAGRLRLTSRASLRIRAEHASLRAEKNLDMDGEHINIG